MRKTTVAKLRSILGLSVKEFADLIGKSAGTVNSLEGSGRLKLSEETALEIAEKTGVSLKWLLDGKPSVEPYCEGGSAQKPYDLTVFEELHAAQQYGNSSLLGYTTEEGVTYDAVRYAVEALRVFYSALSKGKAKLMNYYWSKFMEEMREKLELSDRATDAVVRFELIPGHKGEIMGNIILLRGGRIKVRIPQSEVLWEENPATKSRPLQPSPANARPVSARKSS